MDLHRRFALGEIDAFETLVRQFQGDVYSWIVRIVRDPGIAEDLTLALDHLRRKRPEESLLVEPAGAPQPDGLLQRETREKIQQAFRRLPAKLQVAATLALVEEQPYDEIADALGTSVGAVKVRVFRAIRILRKQLSQLGVRPE
jgi:RNA polymerase sigma-70 factor (ECF subfamily)